MAVEPTEPAVKPEDLGRQLTAPVDLPTDLRLKLADVGQLERLVEYSSDRNYFTACATLAFGAFLGIIVNLVSQDNPTLTKPAGIALVLFLAVGLAFSYMAHMEGSRAKKMRSTIFPTEPAGQKSLSQR